MFVGALVTTQIHLILLAVCVCETLAVAGEAGGARASHRIQSTALSTAGAGGGTTLRAIFLALQGGAGISECVLIGSREVATVWERKGGEDTF